MDGLGRGNASGWTYLSINVTHGAPAFCVKKLVRWRIVHDYRALNSHTIRRTLPLPRKDIIIDKMQYAHWYSCLNFLSGYYQFRMRDSDVSFTAFQAPDDGWYEFLVLPMGLSNAPATFNPGVRHVLADSSEICQSYFDDIYIYTQSPNIDEHLKALDYVLTRLEKHKFYVKLSKCLFCVDEIPTREKVERTEDLRNHFECLKTKISSTPALAIPNFDRPFLLRMNASDFVVGVVLFQKNGEGQA
ncbi:RxLR effector protein [Phytophthora megakarya]|uniref:RxLR effector protein n=1 Tax=Phytophthora megakarya TaxID=4795 RepID=A0A225VGG6_9STRA|nr:RxLR effector protein [Phytophthora megakarya]